MHKLAKMDTPIFWAEGHPGRLEKEKWSLKVEGLCDKPTEFNWQQLMELPQVTVNARLTSVTRWSVRGDWGGIRFKDILDAVGIKDTCTHLRFWSYGNYYDTSIPLSIALKEKSLLATSFDGEDLTEDYGGPIRALIPYLWGYKSAKSIVKIQLMDYYIPGFWELRGYTDAAELEEGPCRDINDEGVIKHMTIEDFTS